MSESATVVSTPAPENAQSVPLDARIRAGAEDYQLGEDEDQDLKDFGVDHEPTEESAADQRARIDPPKAKTTAEVLEKVLKQDETPEKAPETDEKPPETEEKATSRSAHIPRERFDEVNAKFRAAQARLAEFEAAQARAPTHPSTPSTPATPEFDFDAKEAAYMEAVLDGEKDLALSIRKEIRAAEMKAVAAPPAALDVATIKNSLRYDALVEDLNAKYPVFDPNHESFDADLTQEAVTMSLAFQKDGMPPDMALKKAVKYVVAMNEVQEAAPHEPVKANGKAAPKGNGAAKLDPKEVAEKLKLREQQPPAPTGKAQAEPNHDLDSMSEEEFAALPPATLRRLRGDIL